MTFLAKFRANKQKPEPTGSGRTSSKQLIEDLREVRRQLDALQSYFALETDEDLLDAAIYQREALQARYRYLLRLAKESGAAATEPPVIPENKERQIN